MYLEAVEKFAQTAVDKSNFLKSSFSKYFLLSALAGIYIGFGMILIFSIGAPFAADGSPAVKILMGASFGIALSLVIFAGSELFTGNNMTMVIGNLSGKVSVGDTAQIWVASWVGNLFGSLLINRAIGLGLAGGLLFLLVLVEQRAADEDEEKKDCGNDDRGFLLHDEPLRRAAQSRTAMIENETKDSSGMVTKPNQTTGSLEHGTPCWQGLIDRGVGGRPRPGPAFPLCGLVRPAHRGARTPPTGTRAPGAHRKDVGRAGSRDS